MHFCFPLSSSVWLEMGKAVTQSKGSCRWATSWATMLRRRLLPACIVVACLAQR